MVVLGSSSPRRICLLKTIVDDFKIVKPTFDEKLVPLDDPHYALTEAKNKALSLKTLVNPQDLLICCDTIVVLDKEIFGKPKDEKDAYRILKTLNGNTHKVITGYTITYCGKTIEKEIVSYVTFKKLRREELLHYIQNENVMDKAGAYAIQDDEKFHIIQKIKGSLTNIMGFPIESISDDLKSFNII
jgi:septum formation protein